MRIKDKLIVKCRIIFYYFYLYLNIYLILYFLYQTFMGWFQHFLYNNFFLPLNHRPNIQKHDIIAFKPISLNNKTKNKWASGAQ